MKRFLAALMRCTGQQAWSRVGDKATNRVGRRFWDEHRGDGACRLTASVRCAVEDLSSVHGGVEGCRFGKCSTSYYLSVVVRADVARHVVERICGWIWEDRCCCCGLRARTWDYSCECARYHIPKRERSSTKCAVHCGNVSLRSGCR